MAKRRGSKKKKQMIIAVVAIVLVIAIVLGVCWYFLIYSKGLTIGEFLHSLGIGTTHPSDDDSGNTPPEEAVSGNMRRSSRPISPFTSSRPKSGRAAIARSSRSAIQRC